MPKDAVGCKIYQGNQVMVELPAGMRKGVVALIEEGKISLASPDGARPKPGHIVVMVDIHVFFDPNGDGGIGSLVVTRDQPKVGDFAFSSQPEESPAKAQ